MRSDAGHWPARCWPPPWCLPRSVPAALAALLDDFKKLSAARREAAFAALRAAQAAGLVEIGLGAASVAEIVRINILQAALLAMDRAVARLPTLPDLALVDGNRPPRAALSGALRDRRRRARACRSPPPRSSPRCCATASWPGWRRATRNTAGSATPATAPWSIARHWWRSGPTRHHRPTFGLVASARSRRLPRLTRLRRAVQVAPAADRCLPDDAPESPPPVEIVRELPLDQIIARRCRADPAHAAAGLGQLRLRRPALQSAAARRTPPPRRQPGRRGGRRLGPVHRFRRLRRLHPRLAGRVPPDAAQGRHAVGHRQLPQHLPHRRHPAGARLLDPQRRDLAQGQPDAELPRPALHQRARDLDLGGARTGMRAIASTTRP